MDSYPFMKNHEIAWSVMSFEPEKVSFVIHHSDSL